MKAPLSERLLAKTKRVGGCLLWTGATADKFGTVWNEQGRMELAHRVSYRLFVGPIPDKYHVVHAKSHGCESTLCIEPSHLKAVATIGTGTCREGHKQTAENLYTNHRNGERQCRVCHAAAARRYKARQKEE